MVKVKVEVAAPTETTESSAKCMIDKWVGVGRENVGSSMAGERQIRRQMQERRPISSGEVSKKSG